MPASQRKRLGAWYTPPELVAAVVKAVDLAQVVGSGAGGAVRVLDPACGDGRFLVAVRDALAAHGRVCELTGVDIDPAAAPHASVTEGRWICADALTMEWEAATFDIVIGNPPYLNQMAAATTRGGSSRWGGGPYADTAAEFLALAAHVTRPGGWIGLVLPQSLLAARDSGEVRSAVDRMCALRWAWWASSNVFDADVRTWAGVWEREGRSAPVVRQSGTQFVLAEPAAPPSHSRHGSGSWSWAIADCPAPGVVGGDALGSIATFGANFRDEYYGLVPAVTDDGDGPPLVTCGLIDPGRNRWGERPVRFAKRRFEAPRVELGLLSAKMRRWAYSQLVPKILIANQTTAIEAVHDEEGAWIPGVPVITCRTDRPGQVLDVLNRPSTNAWVRYHAAGSGLSASVVRLTPSLLAAIPMESSAG